MVIARNLRPFPYTPSVSSNFAEWLTAAMDRRGLNQSQVASFLDVHPSSVNAWTKATSVPSTANCRKLAELATIDGDAWSLSSSLRIDVHGYDPDTAPTKIGQYGDVPRARA